MFMSILFWAFLFFGIGAAIAALIFAPMFVWTVVSGVARNVGSLFSGFKQGWDEAGERAKQKKQG